MDYIEAGNLPENEKVYLKKDALGWRVIQPIKIDGKINWANLFFGGKRGLVFIIFVLLLFGLYYLGTLEMISNYKKIADNPCLFCSDCQEQTRVVLDNMRITNPEIDFDNIELKEMVINERETV